MITRIKYLSALETVRLYNIQHTTIMGKQHLEFAKQIMKIIDTDIYAVQCRSRNTENVTSRMIITEFLYRRFKNIKDHEVGKVLNRHRTSVLHMRKKHSDYIFYNDYSSLLRKVEVEI